MSSKVTMYGAARAKQSAKAQVYQITIKTNYLPSTMLVERYYLCTLWTLIVLVLPLVNKSKVIYLTIVKWNQKELSDWPISTATIKSEIHISEDLILIAAPSRKVTIYGTAHAKNTADEISSKSQPKLSVYST